MLSRVTVIHGTPHSGLTVIFKKPTFPILLIEIKFSSLTDHHRNKKFLLPDFVKFKNHSVERSTRSLSTVYRYIIR